MALQLNPYYRTLRTCILENVAGLGKRSAATDPRDEYQACPPLWATCCVRLPGCSVTDSCDSAHTNQHINNKGIKSH